MKTWIVPTLVAAVVTVAPAAAAQAAVVAHWQMDEPAGASVMLDSASGGAHDGRIVNVVTGAAGLVPDGGSAYTFNEATSYVEVAEDDRLDPGTAPISLTATVQAVDGAMSDDSYDLVRKGVVTTKGGYWKMEIKRTPDASVGRLHCVFKGVMPDGSRQMVKRLAKPDLVDGGIHTVQCVRSGNTVTAVVDGKPYTTNKPTGSIANNQPVILGAKLAGDDVLRGSLDEVIIEIG
jgi:hypothetical protein